MACNSIACVRLVGPDVDHFVLELPPHTASFGRLYPTTPLLTESLLLHNKLHMKDFESLSTMHWIFELPSTFFIAIPMY